jgi:hypothetical protein
VKNPLLFFENFSLFFPVFWQKETIESEKHQPTYVWNPRRGQVRKIFI